MTDQEKMNEIMRMCMLYVAKQDANTDEDLATRTFDEIEEFINLHSNTKVTFRCYSSLDEFMKETTMEGFYSKGKREDH